MNHESLVLSVKDVALSPIKNTASRSIHTNTYTIFSQLKSYYYEIISDTDLHFYTGVLYTYTFN